METRRPGSRAVQRRRASTCSAPVGTLLCVSHGKAGWELRASHPLLQSLMPSWGPTPWPHLILTASQMPQFQRLWTYESGYWVSQGRRFKGYVHITPGSITTQWSPTMESPELLFLPTIKGQLLTALKNLVTPKDSSSFQHATPPLASESSVCKAFCLASLASDRLVTGEI